MTLASAAFGFGQPLRPNLMFLVGVLALGPVLWWIRTLHIQIRRSRDHFLHVGFLSPPVSAQCPTELECVRDNHARIPGFRFREPRQCDSQYKKCKMLSGSLIDERTSSVFRTVVHATRIADIYI